MGGVGGGCVWMWEGRVGGVVWFGEMGRGVMWWVFEVVYVMVYEVRFVRGGWEGKV